VTKLVTSQASGRNLTSCISFWFTEAFFTEVVLRICHSADRFVQETIYTCPIAHTLQPIFHHCGQLYLLWKTLMVWPERYIYLYL